MKKMFNLLLKHKLYIITFLISLIIISIIYILKGITPFGNKSLLDVDFFHQYGPMLGELHDRIYSGKSLIYSFNLGLGIPFFRNFLNYMSSPFNIIILLFSHKNILTSYSFIIGLKAVFSACTMVYFLSHKFKSKDLILIPLGIMYGFSAYYVAYYWNIMWLDGMVFLPLITLGIEYIINEHKWKFYTIWLTIMLISNYYIGYMICIFSVLYFIFYSIHIFKKTNLKSYIKTIGIFTGASILSGMIASVFLIPLFISLKSISATGDYFPFFKYYKFTIEEFLKYHLTGVSSTVFHSDSVNAPNISAGILSIILFFPFILNKNISIKTKICYLCLLIFFILAFFWVPLDFIMQGFHTPNDLPYRYSFLYTFVIIIISAYSLLNIKKFPLKLLIIECILLFIVLISLLNSSWKGINNMMIIVNIVSSLLYLIIYIVYLKKNSLKNILIFISICIIATTTILTFNKNWHINHDIKSFNEDYTKNKELINYINGLNTNKFYRIEKTPVMTFNDPAWYNYYGMTTFSSMAYESMAKLQHNLGIPGNLINSYYYVQNTPIYNLMFNINYFIGTNNDEKNYITIVNENNSVNLFLYNIGLGFAVQDDLINWDYKNNNPFIVQNDYVKKSSNISNIFNKFGFIEKSIIYESDNEIVIKYIYPPTTDNLYFYSNSYQINYFTINNDLYYLNDLYSSSDKVNEEIFVANINAYKEKYIININTKSQPTELYISFLKFDNAVDYDNLFYLYTMDNQKFIDTFNILKQNRLHINEFKENYIKADITVDESKLIYTSIPYDEGWNIYVDNSKTDTLKLGGSLLAFRVAEGNHTIIFKYIPKGFKIGLLLTITGISILVTFIIIDKRKKRQS